MPRGVGARSKAREEAPKTTGTLRSRTTPTLNRTARAHQVAATGHRRAWTLAAAQKMVQSPPIGPKAFSMPKRQLLWLSLRNNPDSLMSSWTTKRPDTRHKILSNKNLKRFRTSSPCHKAKQTLAMVAESLAAEQPLAARIWPLSGCSSHWCA